MGRNQSMSSFARGVGRRARREKSLTVLVVRKRLIRRKLRRIRNQLLAAQKHERIKYKKMKKRIQQDLFRLENAIRALEEEKHNSKDALLDLPQHSQKEKEEAIGELGAGALPDFLIIGAKKCGTTFLYDLLCSHPYVQCAAKKELHFFDILLEEEGVEWYRRCFPQARWKDGRRTITGEATPYLDDASAPEKVAKVLPRARLIALLRNPVERAYSDYQQARRKGREHLTFEEAIEAAKTRAEGRRGYLSKGIYVDHLMRWSRFFEQEQILVLKSEDLFERTQDTLKEVQGFLGLPEYWAPETLGKRNKGVYEQEGMDPATRQQLEAFYNPHNQRLYEYLSVDIGWENSYTGELVYGA
jgi:hypothetical protein